jgi:glutamate--cysteine ligase
MDVPMYFVYRDGRYVNALGQSWHDFMKGKLPALPGEYPTLSDWANHLTTIFPEVRVYGWVNAATLESHITFDVTRLNLSLNPKL